jgi:hypothetical protein
MTQASLIQQYFRHAVVFDDFPVRLGAVLNLHPVEDPAISDSFDTFFTPWNKGKLAGQKSPLRIKDIWAIRARKLHFGYTRKNDTIGS